MRVIKNVVVSAALMVGGLSLAVAQDSQHAHGASSKASDASKQIVDGLVRGQDDVVARNAQGMHDSFIMAQEMSEADAHALHEALPHAFVERDEAFHELSAQLAEAARAGDQGKQRKLFAEMLDACAACHAAHATDRFPGLTASRR